MKRIKKIIADYTTPADLSITDGIRYWQERVLLTLLLFAAVLGFITWIPSVYLSVKESLWVVAAADTLVLGFVLFIFLRPGLPYVFRASAVPVLAYILGLILITTIGPFAGGPVWLFFFPVLTGVLLGTRPAIWALVINGITAVVIGFLIQADLTGILSRFNFTAWHLKAENPEMKWVVVCFNFMLLNILSTVSVTSILNGLHRSLTELSVSEKKHRQIFENIMDVYFETSLDGRILEVSPSVTQISGFSPGQLKGQSLNRIYQMPEKRAGLLKLLFNEGHIQNHEIGFKDKMGQVRTCSVNARLLNDDQGRPDRVLGIIRDVTELKAIAQRQKALEERLNRSQKMEALGILAGGVAHDLNNVLSGIVTYPELLLMDLDDTSPMAEALKVIQASGLRATEIVQDLLTLSRRGVITREVVDLNQIVRDFLATPEYDKILSFHPHVTVKTALEAENALIKGSAIHLQKSVMNLVSNAAEAQPDGGCIRITTADRHLEDPVRGYDRIRPGDYLILSVEDQGQGIAREDLKRIFEPFFTKKVMGRSGTGLGMAVVWGTIQDHEGYIDVTSEPGWGTRFDLYFPITREKTATTRVPVDLNALAGNRETILIVDDVSYQREIAGTILKRLGYETIALSSGEEAIRFLETRNADLVILDMIMDPGLDGLKTYRRIKALKPGQKAIIASGFSRTRQVTQALELGAGQYIKKPYTIEVIGKAVKEELARQA